MSKYMMQRIEQARREGVLEGRRLATLWDDETVAETRRQGFDDGYREGWLAAVAFLEERITKGKQNGRAVEAAVKTVLA